MKPILAGIAVALSINAVALAAYHHWVIQPIPVVGVVDAWLVFREEQTRHLQAVSSGTDDVARSKALAAARDFAAGYPARLAELQRDCGCLVVDRSAIAALPDGVQDLTPLLRQRVRP
ncbi:hypothetical protein GCM10027277_25470 [Pseudoduganella ginsengisoli]|uniref:Uncharacterized protein n=1 Tax=Pseudoduganella ginsengisoli TaxID=1462440 RepID=A0A6L6PZF6_9BURK|nr:hypothetical protein [Pseudoduganella ginsengisoli]MTW02730.1 hypothetical protein [Pseudoduganella ginsengisoli]